MTERDEVSHPVRVCFFRKNARLKVYFRWDYSKYLMVACHLIKFTLKNIREKTIVVDGKLTTFIFTAGNEKISQCHGILFIIGSD